VNDMRFEVISYSSKAGMELNCDSVAWMDRDDSVSAVLCTAEDASAEAAVKAKQRVGEIMEKIYPCKDGETAEEVCSAISCSGLGGAAVLAVRGSSAVWQCRGSGRIYFFSENGITECSGKEQRAGGKTALQSGDAVMVCSEGFYSHISQTEMDIDLHRSENAAEWLENLLVRQLSESGAAGKSISVLLCMVKN